MKDLFSRQAEEYAKYRPAYPQELYEYIFNFVKHFDCAWDCATGNGQAAVALAGKFKQVFATDLSAKQLQHAIQRPNITYSISHAEKPPFPSQSFDLVTVAQALHWFDFDQFFPELQRVLKPEGIFAAWSYGLLRIDPKIDPIIDKFYDKILAPYWDERRQLIDEKYQTIPFPLKKIKTPAFEIKQAWSFEHFIKYFSTWSSVETYMQKNGANPIELIQADLLYAWGNPVQPKAITWPIYLLLGHY